MKRMEELAGVLVPIVTPMYKDGLDCEGMTHLAERYLQSDYVDGLFALGATGEYLKLNSKERKLYMQALAKVNSNDKKIIVNTGGGSYKEVLDLTQYASKLNLDVVAIVVPKNLAANPDAIVEYYLKISKIGIPFVVYWTPYIEQKPSSAVIEKLMDIPEFIGYKDSSRDMEVFAEICAHFGQEISIFQGVEMLHLPSLACGSSGIIGGGLNIYPGLLAQITEAFNKHEFSKARELQQKASNNWAELNKYRSFRWICKGIWKNKGFIDGEYCRISDFVSFSSEEMEKIKNMICF